MLQNRSVLLREVPEHPIRFGGLAATRRRFSGVMDATPLRVCHVMTADLWAGAEVQVATLASYLVNRPEVQVSAVLFNDGWLASELRALGITVAVVDEHRHTPLGIVRFLTRFFRRHQVELIHTHRYKDNILGTIAAAFARVPHVIRTVHGRSEPLRGLDWLKFQVYQSLDLAAMWSRADRVVAVSKGMVDALKESGYRPGTLTHVRNGIDLSKIHTTASVAHTREALGLNVANVVIGTAGRLAPVKGHEYLVRAAARIVQQESQARFLFVGTGPLEPTLRGLARQLGVDHACIFVDPAIDRRASVYDLIAAMDVFVLPSLHEGIPMALLEALALERPVVASAVGGIPEIVTHEATGLLVEPKNDRALADACLDLVRDSTRARRLAVGGRRTVEREFSHQQNGEAMLELYRAVVAESLAGDGVEAAVERDSRGRVGSRAS
jgi:glycosyltransferase involved in cell wall biosynthesis